LENLIRWRVKERKKKGALPLLVLPADPFDVSWLRYLCRRSTVADIIEHVAAVLLIFLDHSFCCSQILIRKDGIVELGLGLDSPRVC
jgi:hypothetical protein